MKRFENELVKPFEKFAWDNDKSRLAIKLPLKAVENPLLLYVEFSENSEKFVFGEEKAVRQIAGNSDCLAKYENSMLMISAERPLGSLLLDSYDFVTNHLLEVTNIFHSMLHSIDSGNSEKASDYKMLEKLWQEGNTFQRIVINYFFCRFYRVKHLAANGTAGIFAYTVERRQQMYSDLEQSMEQEFELLQQNPITLSDLKVLHIYNKDQAADKFICLTFAEFYAKYIPYLAEKNLFFRVCPRCGKPFYADTSRRHYHSECAKLQDKGNKLRSQRTLEQNNFYKQCQEERYSYHNFRRGRAFKHGSKKLQDKYLALFEEFKKELPKQKIKLQGENAVACRTKANAWLEKKVSARKDLEKKFRSLLG